MQKYCSNYKLQIKIIQRFTNAYNQFKLERNQFLLVFTVPASLRVPSSIAPIKPDDVRVLNVFRIRLPNVLTLFEIPLGCGVVISCIPADFLFK